MLLHDSFILLFLLSDKKTLDFEASFKTLTEERDELKKNLTDFGKCEN